MLQGSRIPIISTCSFACVVFTLSIVALPTVTAERRFSLSPQLLDQVSKQYGRRAAKRLTQWQRLIEDNQGKTDVDKLKLVNRFFNNKVRFISDKRHWGKRDYWATPVETLATRGGDCEDYSIAKYFTLRELGVPDERLRITYVRARRLQQPHMVLSYYASPTDIPLILDNLTGRIMPANKRRDLVPVFSFNGSRLWSSKQRGRGSVVGNSNQVSKWKGVNNRIKRELAIGQ